MMNLGNVQHEKGKQMYSMVRFYSGPGAKELFDLLVERKSEVESILRDVSGLVSYDLIQTAEGGVTVTVCENKAGTDESLAKAVDWLKENAGHLSASPPGVSEGPVAIHLT